MVSLLQTAGRVNRNGSQKDAEVWTFQLQDAPLLKRNPGLERSAAVLLKYLKEGLTPAPELSTDHIDQSSTNMGLYNLPLNYIRRNIYGTDFLFVRTTFKII